MSIMSISEGKPPLTVRKRIQNAWLKLQREWRIFTLNQQVSQRTDPKPGERPVVLFNASTRLGGFSQNAAFNLLTAWGLQLAGLPVVHFVCRAGMSRCVLGTNPDDHTEAPPCSTCIAQSGRLLRSGNIHWFEAQPAPTLDAALAGLSTAELSTFQWKVVDKALSIHGEIFPLGELVLPALRWALRRHDLLDDVATRYTFREYIKSAYQVGASFDKFLEQRQPQAVVIFNGTMFPEAIARWVALKRSFRVITHEVGFQPFSAFFTDGKATAYPMRIPESFDLSPQQSVHLDDYLSRRFKGDFTMAGIRFWPQMSDLGVDFMAKASQFKQIVPVFTNVVNDTSQVHACSVFEHMYDWLDHVATVILQHPEIFFVIRAHPDEKRRGTRKHSRQPVSDWIIQQGVDRLPNVVFVDSNEPLSSYALIQKSKFVIVYNSSIGLEAALLGVPVLCGGKARYTQYPTVFFPQTPSAFLAKAGEFLAADTIEIPSEFQRNARRVLYWQLYRSAIPFSSFLSAHPTPGYVQLKRFSWRDLRPEKSISMGVIVDGIKTGKPFIMPDPE
jgi:hypothetical protein